MLDLKGKWVLITGASRGLGRLATKLMAEQGCNLILHSRDLSHTQKVMSEVKAMGVELSDRGIVQVSINMTDYTRTALYRVFETVKFEAARWGVTIAGSEIIGLVPMAALIDTAEYYLGIEDFSMAQVLESRIMEE